MVDFLELVNGGVGPEAADMKQVSDFTQQVYVKTENCLLCTVEEKTSRKMFKDQRLVRGREAIGPLYKDWDAAKNKTSVGHLLQKLRRFRWLLTKEQLDKVGMYVDQTIVEVRQQLLDKNVIKDGDVDSADVNEGKGAILKAEHLVLADMGTSVSSGSAFGGGKKFEVGSQGGGEENKRGPG